MKKYCLSFFVLLIFHLNPEAQFKPGYYYDKHGKKISGLLKFEYGGSLFTDKSDGDCDVKYKENADARKIKLTTNDISSFVIGEDSFAIVKDFSINSFVTYPQDFAKVLEAGKINLYLYYAIIQNGMNSSTVTYWLVEKNGRVESLKRGNFKNLLTKDYIEDYPELIEKLANKELKFKNSREIIKMYNDHFAGNSGTKQ